ncbi:uncharacterized protein ACIBXB_008200 [Morphnus guianensis]
MVGSNVLVPVSLPGPVAHSFRRRKTWRDQSVRPGNPAAMRRLRVLEGCCLCVGLQSRPTHPGGRSRVTGSVPAAGPTVAAVVTSLLERLQDNEGDRVQTYRQLESALQGGDGRLQSGVLNRLIAEASGDIRAAQVSLFSLKTEVPQCPCESSFSWGALPGEERPYPVPRWGAYRASEPLCARAQKVADAWPGVQTSPWGLAGETGPSLR